MLGKGEEIERLEASKGKRAVAFEKFEIGDEALESAGEVDEALGRRFGEGARQCDIEAASRWVDDDEIRTGQTIQSIPRCAGENRRSGALRVGPLGESEFESAQTVRASLVEADRLGFTEKRQPNRSDATIIFRDRLSGRNQFGNSIDGTLEERQMILAEGAGGKIHVHPTDRFVKSRVSRKVNHAGPENRVAALGLTVEEKTL